MIFILENNFKKKRW